MKILQRIACVAVVLASCSVAGVAKAECTIHLGSMSDATFTVPHVNINGGYIQVVSGCIQNYSTDRNVPSIGSPKKIDYSSDSGAGYSLVSLTPNHCEVQMQIDDPTVSKDGTYHIWGEANSLWICNQLQQAFTAHLNTALYLVVTKPFPQQNQTVAKNNVNNGAWSVEEVVFDEVK